MFSAEFDCPLLRLFAFGFAESVGKLSGRAEGIDRVFLMVRVVVPVHIDEGLLGHAEIARRFPCRDGAGCEG